MVSPLRILLRIEPHDVFAHRDDRKAKFPASVSRDQSQAVGEFCCPCGQSYDPNVAVRCAAGSCGSDRPLCTGRILKSVRHLYENLIALSHTLLYYLRKVVTSPVLGKSDRSWLPVRAQSTHDCISG
jgi:hypothetical protein